MLDINDHDVGGARVRRTFTRSGETMRMGQMLSAAEVLAIPITNRRALSDSNFIEVFPRGPLESVGENHIVHLGRGQFDVIRGVKLNAAPLTKDDAEELATRPS